jgi:serine/threonine protein kinase HipA of HipAB toxin-antitoxin module
MAAAAFTAATPPTSEPDDRRFALHGVTWAQYLAVRAMFDDRTGLRMNFVEGTLELMSPSRRRRRIPAPRLSRSWSRAAASTN